MHNRYNLEPKRNNPEFSNVHQSIPLVVRGSDGLQTLQGL